MKNIKLSGVITTKRKLTVATNKQNDEIYASNYPDRGYTTVRSDAVIHHHIPIFTGQDLDSSGKGKLSILVIQFRIQKSIT